MVHGHMFKIIDQIDFTLKSYTYREKYNLIRDFIAEKWMPHSNGQMYPVINDKYGLYLNLLSLDRSKLKSIIVDGLDEYSLIKSFENFEWVLNVEVISIGEIIEYFYNDTELAVLSDVERKYDALIASGNYSTEYPLGIGFMFNPPQ